MSHLALAEAIIKQHEGFRAHPYECTAGRLTIGYGRNLEANGVSHDEGLAMLANDIYQCERDLASFTWWAGLGDNQKAALLDLRFCVGAGGFRGFRKMISAIEVGDLQRAAREILDSRFANQTGNRAQDLADLLVMDG